MVETVSATEARIHLGELMQRAVEEERAIVIERSGKPLVVVLSVDVYERLLAAQGPAPSWQELVDQARARARADLNEHALPAPEKVLSEIREARDDRLVDLRRR